MLIKNLKYTFILLTLLATIPCFAQQRDFDTITHRVVEKMLNRGNADRLTKSVTQSLTTLQPNGTWADINYTDNAMAIWSPALHLSRVQEFAMAYANSNSSYSGNTKLYGAIIKALQAWNRVDPKCKNWWFNEINCPQLLGQIMLLMQSAKPLPAPLQDSLLVKMNRGDMYKQIGANKLDVALHNMYRALLTRNVVLMDSAVSQCFQPIILTNTPEGLMYDYSYLQHGRQLQIASYGSVFLVSGYRVAGYVRGTKWQISTEKGAILAKFLNDVFLNAIRYKYFDFSVMGRGFTRKDSGNAGAISGLWADIVNLKNAEGNSIDFAGYINASLRASGKVPASYQIKPVHHQYWIGDYTQHATPEYLFTVRTNSTRTKRLETGNGENLYGRYMSDGATNIQRSGSEYFNIFPVWENDKVPGVTCRDYATDRPVINAWDQPGNTNFTGGVSDGVNGASTYTLDFDSVKAKKSWFFFGKQVVCLGAGIQANAPENITTAINQCWSRGDVAISSSKQAYWQDSIGYYFQPGEKVNYTNANQKGTWKHINNSQSADVVSGKVFKLWIDHGKHPQNASYAYVVIPGISARQFSSRSPFNQLKVIRNNDEQQAIFDVATNTLQAVFYLPGTIKTGNILITANVACVLMLKKDEKSGGVLFVADPSHQSKSVIVTVNNEKINCTLPVNEYAGSTVKFTIK
jgi:chondroitin AC lyase